MIMVYFVYYIILYNTMQYLLHLKKKILQYHFREIKSQIIKTKKCIKRIHQLTAIHNLLALRESRLNIHVTLSFSIIVNNSAIFNSIFSFSALLKVASFASKSL